MNGFEEKIVGLPSTGRASGGRRVVLLVVLLGALGWGQGCYHYRVVVPQPNPATEYEHRTMHAFLWGLVQQDMPADDCLANTLDEVRVTTNLGYALISVVTLGIWVPLDVEWRCARPPVQDNQL